jgi:hypothetical protein
MKFITESWKIEESSNPRHYLGDEPLCHRWELMKSSLRPRVPAARFSLVQESKSTDLPPQKSSDNLLVPELLKNHMRSIGVDQKDDGDSEKSHEDGFPQRSVE